jgi:hypothetical protein
MAPQTAGHSGDPSAKLLDNAGSFFAALERFQKREKLNAPEWRKGLRVRGAREEGV